MIDHVTVHLHSTALHNMELSGLMTMLGFKEVRADREIEGSWDVRWFAHFENVGNSLVRGDTMLHLVAADNWGEHPPEPGLSHFCVTGVGQHAFEKSKRSGYLEHHGNPNRLWINYHGLRIEVRP